jgi:hypothetical protein
MLFVWMSLWRDVLLHGTGASTPPANLDRQGEITTLAIQVGYIEAQKIAAALGLAIQRLDQNINTRLALEVLLLDFPVVVESMKTE